VSEPVTDPDPFAPEAVLRALSGLDPAELKAAGGMVLVMMSEAERARDREWVSEHFVQVASQALELPAGELAADDTLRLQSWVRAHMGRVLNATYALFGRVASDLAQRHGPGGFAYVDAARCAAEYLGRAAPARDA